MRGTYSWIGLPQKSSHKLHKCHPVCASKGRNQRLHRTGYLENQDMLLDNRRHPVEPRK